MSTDWNDVGQSMPPDGVPASENPFLTPGERIYAPKRVEAPRTAPVPFSDDDLADRASQRHGTGLRYCNELGRWFEWDGTRWHEEKTRHVWDLVRLVCRDVAAQAEHGDNAKRLGVELSSNGRVSSVERMMAADRRHAVLAEVWDLHPWLLNTPGGTVDLRTGRVKPHDRGDMLTRRTAVSPEEPGEACGMWFAFLERITGGDGELIDYLQRLCGYVLTGDTSEHAMFFAWGTGANGKSTFVSVLAGILGDYAATAPMETFTVSHVDRHPTDLAGMRGARLVTATETTEGKRLDVAKVKQLTGGDLVAARFMRGDFFTYRPEFKLFLSGNHKPVLRTIDEGLQRRLHLVPFPVTVPKPERDKKLGDRLRAEWPAILGWMVEGTRRWLADGLSPPAAVTAATQAYVADEDELGGWLDDRCQRGAGYFERTADLFGDWKSWCEQRGEAVGTMRRFSQALQDRGFTASRTGHGGQRCLKGLRLATRAYDGDAR